MDRTPPQSEDLMEIFYNHRQSGPLLSDSVTERWQLKPEALGSIPGGTTFLSFPLLFQGFQTVTDQIAFD